MIRTPRGFTLLETLVSLVVLSVGLLGAAALLLDNLRSHAGALRRVAALGLVRDMADRIRTNPLGGVHYNTRVPAPAASAVTCGEPGGCDIAQLAATDLAHFISTAHALFPRVDTNAQVEYAPATGHAMPARYIITLRWSDARNDAGTDSVALQVLAQTPVAG